MDVIKQIQQAIVYIEDHLLEPLHLQALSDYVGLSPFHIDQSFKMIVGQSPTEYARSRRLTLAAQDILSGSARLVDVAKSIAIKMLMILLMILVIFMVFLLFKSIQNETI